jgi:hypothetical protein
MDKRALHSMAVTSLHHYFDPANYHPDAVANAAQGSLADLDISLLLIRLGIALYKEDHGTAHAVLSRLETENLEGYPLWQKTTASLILALQSHDEHAILMALDAWLVGRKRYPGNWVSQVLDAPELKPWLGKIDPSQLIPPTIKRKGVTRKERAFVKDIDNVRQSAVRDNLTWLRTLGATQSEAALAKRYRLASVNLTLKECGLDAGDILPGITVSLDDQGQYVGSFIGH